MDILITGASGYVGSRLYFDLSKYYKTIGTYNTKSSEEFAKLDITDKQQVFDAVKAYRPSIIVHSAGLVGSKLCDADPEGAIEINDKGTQNIVEAANHFGSVVLYVSTIAAHEEGGFYNKTKLKGEDIARTAKPGFVILRLANVYGMSPNTQTDNIFNRLLWTVEGREESTHYTIWKFQPTWIGHISEVIASVFEKNIRNQEINIMVPEMKSKFEIAKDILSEFEVEAKPYDEKYPRISNEFDIQNLKKLELPMYNYREIKDRIIKEIKEREKYRI